MKKKNMKIETEEQKELKKFIFVILGLVIIIVGIYFFTRAFVTKDLFKNTSEKTYASGTIDYDIAIVGNMLSRPYTEYYVMAFSSEDTEAVYYNTLVNKYVQNEKTLKVYYINTESELNKKYVAKDEDSKSTSFISLDKLQMGNITLMRIKNGKVTKYITNVEDIKKEFGI